MCIDLARIGGLKGRVTYFTRRSVPPKVRPTDILIDKPPETMSRQFCVASKVSAMPKGIWRGSTVVPIWRLVASLSLMVRWRAIVVSPVPPFKSNARFQLRAPIPTSKELDAQLASSDRDTRRLANVWRPKKRGHPEWTATVPVISR